MFQPPKGTRDFLPEDAEKLQFVIDTARVVFEKYGFKPLETPAFESFELLAAKGGGGEAIKDEIYYFKDKGERELGLRFDLTVPLARVIANNPNIPKPFKRYQIGKAWRYDNPQALRYREFWQADIDTIGSSSQTADAECVAAVVECLQKLGIKNFFVNVGNRRLVEDILLSIGIGKEKVNSVFRVIDKLNKIGAEEVKKELNSIGVAASDILEITELKTLKEIEKRFGTSLGLKEFEEFFEAAKYFGIEKFIRLNLSLVRGLDYYTGTVFEVLVGDEKVSFGGGGRYDKLIELYGGQPIPATGISIGVDRIIAAMEKSKLFNFDSKTKVFVAAVNDEVRPAALKLAQNLRKNNITADLDLANRKLGKQLEYAAATAANFAAIVGPDELKKKSVVLRNMKTGKEKTVKIENLALEIQKHS